MINSKYKVNIGDIFGYLTILDNPTPNKKKPFIAAKILVKCKCGVIKLINFYDMIHGKILSCGCKNKQNTIDRNYKHGDSQTRLYKIWCGIIKRCNSINRKDAHRYKLRGIQVCEEWNDYLIFKDWALNNGYQEDLEIDRINNNSSYEPSNCRWCSHKINGRNQSTTHLYEYNGEYKTLGEWAESKICIVGYKTLIGRIYAGKWPLNLALTTPICKKGYKANYNPLNKRTKTESKLLYS